MNSQKSNSNPIKNMLYIDTGQMSRTRRLLTIALQMPQIANLSKKLNLKRKMELLHSYFRRWSIETDLWRKHKLRRKQLFEKSSIAMQKIVRGFVSRRRVDKLRRLKAEKAQQEEMEKLLKMEKLMQMKIAREQAMAELEELLMKKQIEAATKIQKAFRGFLQRGEMILFQRKKLLQQLRTWAHGITNNLYGNRDLQAMEMQAMIYTAVHFTTLPSKPIRNLPTLDQIKRYRAGIFAVRWKIANTYNMKKFEMKKRKEELFLMKYEEILSKAYERSLLLRNEKIALKQRLEMMLLERELLEAERRNANMSHQFLQDLQNRKQTDIREQKEALWRIEEANRKDREAIEQALRNLQKRELELMKHEDLLSKTYKSDYIQYQLSVEQQHVEFQSISQKLHENYLQSRLLNMKLYNTAYMPTIVTVQPGYHAKQQYQNKSCDQIKLGERTRFKHNMPYSMTYSYMFNQVKLQLSIWIESWKSLLSTLPFKSKYVLQVEDCFNCEFMNNNETIDKFLNNILHINFFSYAEVYKRLHLWSLTSTKLYAMSLTKSFKSTSSSSKDSKGTNFIQMASQLVKYIDMFSFGEDLLKVVDDDFDNNSCDSSIIGQYRSWKNMFQSDTVFEALDVKTMSVVVRDYMELSFQLQDASGPPSRPNSLRRNSSYTSNTTSPIRPFSGKQNSIGNSDTNSPKLNSPITPSGGISSKYLFRSTSSGKKNSNTPKKIQQSQTKAPSFVRPPKMRPIPFDNAPHYSLPLSYRLIYPVERLTKLYYLIQYSYLVKLRKEKYQVLFQSIAMFQKVHQELCQLRQYIKSTKLLRFERQQQLQRAAEYENILIKVRKSMVSSGLWLYECMFYEIKLFLTLFYSTQDLVESPWLQSDSNIGEDKFISSFGSRKERSQRLNPSRMGSSNNRSFSNLNRGNSSKKLWGDKSYSKIKIIQPKQVFTYSLKSMKTSHLSRSKTLKKIKVVNNGGLNSISNKNKFQGKPQRVSKDKTKMNSIAKNLSSSSNKFLNFNDVDDTNTILELDNFSTGSNTSSKSVGSSKSFRSMRNNATDSNLNDNLQLSPNRSRKRLDQDFFSNEINILPIDAVEVDDTTTTSSSYMGTTGGRNTPSFGYRNTITRTNSRKELPASSSKIRNFSNINDKFRTFNHVDDDHESYWYDLHVEDFHTITPLDVIKLAIPPLPSYDHDGRPHVVKQKMKASNRKFVYDSDSSEHSEHSESPHKSRQSYRRGRTKDGQHKNKATFMNSRISNFTNSLKASKKKERKFFDIPGENLFLQPDIHKYDFYIWCDELVEWIQAILHWKSPLEQQWKDQQRSGCFACLQRIDYLSSYSLDIEDATILELIQRHGVYKKPSEQNGKKNPYSVVTKSENKNIRIPKNSVTSNVADGERSLAIMNMLNFATVEEMYELLLSKSDIYVAAFYQGKEYKLTIDAETLDDYIGRHPISLFIREMMLQDVQYFQSSKIISSLSFSKNMTMIDLVEQHQNNLLTPLFQKRGVGNDLESIRSMELFNVLTKEIFELEQTIETLIAQRLLTFHVYNPQKSIVNTGLYFTPSVLPANWYNTNRVVSKEHMVNIQTDEHWFFQFPAFMQPVFHIGEASPPETFLRRLLREQKEGTQGKYTRINRLDKKLDVVVKKFVRELKKRQAVTKFLLEYFEKQRKYEIDRILMALEDKLGIIHRFRRNMQLLEMAQSSCCFRLCGICCLPKYAKIHLETSSFQERQYSRALEKMKQLEKQLKYLRTYPIHYKNSMFSKIWKSIVSNNHNKTDEFIRLCQEFRIEIVESADFKKLSTSLKAIDHMMDAKKYTRTRSWITGEAVHMSNDGSHLDPKELILPKLVEMSSTYSSFVPFSVGNDIGAFLNESLTTMPKCKESFIAGGLKTAMCLMRIVENEEVNERGTLMFETFNADTITSGLRVGGRDFFSEIYTKFVPRFFTSFASNQFQLFWSNMSQKIIRTGYSLYPFCDNSAKHPAGIVTYRQHYFEKKCLEYFTHERTKHELLTAAQLIAVLPGIIIKARYQLEDISLKRLIILQAHIRRYLTKIRKANST